MLSFYWLDDNHDKCHNDNWTHFQAIRVVEFYDAVEQVGRVEHPVTSL